MKKRDFFAVLAAGVAVTVAAQALYKWFRGDPEYDYEDEYEDDYEDEALEEEALEATMSQSYDEGFADGLNADYQGSNPAAMALQAEMNQLLDECEKCPWNDEAEGGAETEETAQASAESTGSTEETEKV